MGIALPGRRVILACKKQLSSPYMEIFGRGQSQLLQPKQLKRFKAFAHETSLLRSVFENALATNSRQYSNELAGCKAV